MRNVLKIERSPGGGQALKDKNDYKFTFFETLCFSTNKKLLIPQKTAFSIAEAMVTLLIVSVVLAATAPIMSKKISEPRSGNDSVPAGAVMFFKKMNNYRTNNGCPPGWTIIDGLDNRYVALTSNFESIETTQEDGLPNITGYLGRSGDFGFATNGSTRLEGAFAMDMSGHLPNRGEGHNSTWSRNVIFDASLSNPIYGRSESVRPRTVYLAACSKD